MEHFQTNVTITLQYGTTKIRYTIFRIKPYNYDTNNEYITTENYVGLCQQMITSYKYFYIIFNLEKNLYNWMCTGTLTHIKIYLI